MRTSITRGGHAGSGLLAAVLGLAAGHLTAAVTTPSASPVLAVGSTVIDATPTPVKEWAIRTFGTADKPILIGSVLLAVLILAGIAGVLAGRRLLLGVGMLLLLVSAAGAAVLARPAAGPVDLLPTVVTGAVGATCLPHLLRRRTLSPGATTGADLPGPAGATRRTVLLGAALATAAAAMGGAGQWIVRLRTRPQDVDLPAAVDPARPLPRGLEEEYDGITRFRTPRDEFYRVDTRLDVPIVDVDDWSLRIDGDVRQEVSFTFDEIAAMDLIERDITLTCVSNSVGGEYVGGARWLGVPLTVLLDRAGVGDRADQILSTDVDGMTISTPLALATDGRDAMLAIGMNGEALPREHGFPARLVIPGLYGFISATKWITRMTLTTYDDAVAYWTERGWATEAPIKISSRIDTPRALAKVPAGDTFVGGIAWAQQNGGVARVQVRLDGGPWRDAELGPSAGNDYWRQWYLPWRAEPGRHRIASRVIDGNGSTQTAVRAAPFPDGSSGIQELIVTVE